MTTIATNGKVIAGDGIVLTSWGLVTARGLKKIHVRNGNIFAFAGAAALIDPLIQWHHDGCDVKALPPCDHDGGWSMVVCDADGVHLYTSKAPFRDVLELPFALGTGGDYAMGAMLAGATPEEAVHIACKLDNGSGGEIQVIDIEEVRRAHLAETEQRATAE